MTTISNDKGRLTQQQIDAMVEDAEKFKAQDTEHERQTAAKQDLQNYCYQLEETLANSAMAEKLSDEEREEFEMQPMDALEWLDKNENLKAEQYEQKKKDIEAVVKPLMMKMYAQEVAGGKKKSRRGNRRR